MGALGHPLSPSEVPVPNLEKRPGQSQANRNYDEDGQGDAAGIVGSRSISVVPTLRFSRRKKLGASMVFKLSL